MLSTRPFGPLLLLYYTYILPYTILRPYFFRHLTMASRAAVDNCAANVHDAGAGQRGGHKSRDGEAAAGPGPPPAQSRTTSSCRVVVVSCHVPFPRILIKQKPNQKQKKLLVQGGRPWRALLLPETQGRRTDMHVDESVPLR